MEILKVDLPLYKVIPARRAKPGQFLEGDVYGRNDEFIAERGTEIDDKLLNKFDNFDVRRLAIREHQKTWIPDDERPQLPSDARILREEEFDGPLESPVESLFGNEFEAEMIRLLEEMIDAPEDREERDENLLGLREEVDGLLEEIRAVRDELDDLPETTKTRVRTVLAGSVIDLGKNFLQLPGPDKQLREYLALFKRRDRLRRRVIEQLSARPELVVDNGGSGVGNGASEPSGSDSLVGLVDREFDAVDVSDLARDDVRQLNRKTERILEEQRGLARELEGIEGTQELRRTLREAGDEDVIVNPKTLVSIMDDANQELPERVKELIEQRQKLQERLEEAAAGTSDVEEESASGTEDDGSGGDPSPDRIKELLDQFDAGKRFLAVKNTVDFVRDQDDDLTEYVDRLKRLMRTLKEYREENETLRERVEESARNPEDRTYFEELMEGEESLDPDRLLEMDVDMMFVETIEQHFTKRDEIQETFEDLMWDLKTDPSVAQ